MYEHKTVNPFTGAEHTRRIDVSDLIEKEEFEALKKFIADHLRPALASELIEKDAYKEQKLQWLITQLYQPTTRGGLLVKLLKFQEYLFDVKEYNEVLAHLSNSPGDLTVGDVL